MDNRYKDRAIDLLDMQWRYYITQNHNTGQLAYYYGMREAFDAVLAFENSTVVRNGQGKHSIVDLPK